MPDHEVLERLAVPGLNPGHELFVRLVLFIWRAQGQRSFLWHVTVMRRELVGGEHAVPITVHPLEHVLFHQGRANFMQGGELVARYAAVGVAVKGLEQRLVMTGPLLGGWSVTHTGPAHMVSFPVVWRFCSRKFFRGDFPVAVCIEVCKGAFCLVFAVFVSGSQRCDPETDQSEYGDDFDVHGNSSD